MQIVHEPALTRLAVVGSLGIADVAAVLDEVRPLVALGKPVELDLAEAGHLHPAALQVFIALEGALAAAGLGLRVVRAAGSSADALALCGLDRWLGNGGVS